MSSKLLVHLSGSGFIIQNLLFVEPSSFEVGLEEVDILWEFGKLYMVPYYI